MPNNAGETKPAHKSYSSNSLVRAVLSQLLCLIELPNCPYMGKRNIHGALDTPVILFVFFVCKESRFGIDRAFSDAVSSRTQADVSLKRLNANLAFLVSEFLR